MTTIADIPSCTALHFPTSASSGLPLSTGDLSLTILPANPPSRPSPTLTLTVGASSWPILPSTPVRKVQAEKEHASYAFNPAAADGGAAIGEVRILMKDSKSPGEWQATEALCKKFEDALKANKVWDERILFVNDEYESAGASTKTWGETIAGAVMNAGHAAVDKLNAYTEQHVATHDPKHPAPPGEKLAHAAHHANFKSAALAENADATAVKIGETIHEQGKKLGGELPDNVAQAAKPVPEHEKSDFRKEAEGAWAQATIAGKGIAEAATQVAGALSTNAHKVVENSFGKQADVVAQDIGATGANLGQTALAAGKATSVIVQGANVTTGAIKSAGATETAPAE